MQLLNFTLKLFFFTSITSLRIFKFYINTFLHTLIWDNENKYNKTYFRIHKTDKGCLFYTEPNFLTFYFWSYQITCLNLLLLFEQNKKKLLLFLLKGNVNYFFYEWYMYICKRLLFFQLLLTFSQSLIFLQWSNFYTIHTIFFKYCR